MVPAGPVCDLLLHRVAFENRFEPDGHIYNTKVVGLVGEQLRLDARRTVSREVHEVMLSRFANISHGMRFVLSQIAVYTFDSRSAFGR